MPSFRRIIVYLKSKSYTEWIIVSIIFLLVSALFMGSSLTSCRSTVLGKSGDHTSGIVYANFTHPKRPWPGFSPLTNYPYGENLRIPVSATTQIPSLIHWSLSKITGLVCGWNLLVLLGYMSNALIMYAFIRWLTGNKLISFFGGYAISFTPYHAYAATGQIAGMFSFIFIIAIWRFIILWRKPNLLNALILGLVFGISYYTDGYFILLSLVTIVAIWLAIISYAFLFFRRNYLKLKSQVLSFLISNIVALIFLLPLVWVNVRFAKELQEILGNARSSILLEAQTYSAKLSYYISPKSIIYIGISIILLVIFYITYSRKAIMNSTKKELENKNSHYFVGWTLVFILIVSIWFSLQPIFHIGSQELYNPSYFIISLTSVWRVFGRLYILASISAVILASLGLKLLSEKYHKKKLLIILLAIAIVAFELGLPSLKFKTPTFSYKDAPDIYRWLSDNKDIKAIAEYPIEGYGYQADYFTYLQISNTPIINANLHNSPQLRLKQSIIGINDPQTIPVLRALGVGLVNIRDITFERAKLNINIRKSVHSNKQLSEILPYGKNNFEIDSYKINPGPMKSYALAIEQSPHLFTKLLTNGTAEYINNGNVKLGLEYLPNGVKSNTKMITFELSEANQRKATIIQNGALLWSGTITPEKTNIRISVLTDQPIEIYSQSTDMPTSIILSSLETID